MVLDLRRFYQACNPGEPLSMSNAEERQYYIDFSPVRGGRIIEALERTIADLSPNQPTCQLFTGHIGCGKSTELLRLKAGLERRDFHVVYFESSHDLELNDVDVTDILLAIAGQVSESLEAIKIRLQPGYFASLFAELSDFLHTPIELSGEAELSLGIGKLTAKTKESPNLRHRMRNWLEPRTNSILQAINDEILLKADAELKRRGKQGLVVIVDNLDRVDLRPMPVSGRSQPEYLFIDRGEQLRKLKCHVVYTIPLSLIFSNECETLKNRLGGGLTPKVLPMVPVRLRTGDECVAGMSLLRQMVLKRAFPDPAIATESEQILAIFDTSATLDRLCWISGGHVRNLLGLLYSCLQQQDPPLSKDCLESVIRERRDYLISSIDDREWELLFQVVKQQMVRGDIEYQTLLRSQWVYEYRDSEGSWFCINPALAETRKFQQWLRNNSITL
ncbi:MAG: KAP family NTPase [Desertifilum sp.]|nr:KAP family NTPase [Desertifilum sp.]